MVLAFLMVACVFCLALGLVNILMWKSQQKELAGITTPTEEQKAKLSSAKSSKLLGIILFVAGLVFFSISFVYMLKEYVLVAQ
jgi:preprotein translocase subunit SecG